MSMDRVEGKPHIMAEAWRMRLGLSRPQLARLTGYSISHIQNMEAGLNLSTGAAIRKQDMQRYKLVCAAIHAGLDFNWKQCAILPKPAILAAKGML
jgi:transcriptional regulator with XRE-family HTH domain